MNTTDDADEKFRHSVGIDLRRKLKRHKQNKRTVKATSPANEFLPSHLVGQCAQLLKKTIFSQSAKLLSSRDGKESIKVGDSTSKSSETVLPVGKDDIGSTGESGSDSLTDCSSLEVELEEGELSSSSLSSDSEEYQSCSEENVSHVPMQPGTDWEMHEPVKATFSHLVS